MIFKTVLLVGASVVTLSSVWASNAEQNTPNNVPQTPKKMTCQPTPIIPCPPTPRKRTTVCFNYFTNDWEFRERS